MTNADKQETFLLDQINQKIKDFQKDSAKHKNLHRAFRYGAFAFTAILSVLSGLALYYPSASQLINIAILVISATAGFVASWEGTRKADELWIHERTTLYALIDLKREWEFTILGENNKKEKRGEIFHKLQTLLNQSGEKWSSGIVAGKAYQE